MIFDQLLHHANHGIPFQISVNIWPVSLWFLVVPHFLGGAIIFKSRHMIGQSLIYIFYPLQLSGKQQLALIRTYGRFISWSIFLSDLPFEIALLFNYSTFLTPLEAQHILNYYILIYYFIWTYVIYTPQFDILWVSFLNHYPQVNLIVGYFPLQLKRPRHIRGTLCFACAILSKNSTLLQPLNRTVCWWERFFFWNTASWHCSCELSRRVELKTLLYAGVP